MSVTESCLRSDKLRYYSNSLLAPISSEKYINQLFDHIKGYEIDDIVTMDQGAKIIGQDPTQESVIDTYKEYIFKTRNEGIWNVRYHGNQPPFSMVDYDQDEFMKFTQSLAISQSLDFPLSRTSKDGIHAMGIHFVAQNLNIIDQIITNKPSDVKNEPKVLIMEANVPHPKRNAQMRIDIGFLGSDNRFHILEHGNSPDKSRKTNKYVGGCKILYRQSNEGEGRLRHSRIDGHVVNYSKTDKGFELDFYQPEDLEFYKYINWIEKKRRLAGNEILLFDKSTEK